ncbi:hypothetical protein HB364_18510 [Pseudoflavitalea sp. X16]|uniref:hypothetical protein n=1 Tax=Paraflavitalea devenefica TaxID=2716334 RepID=UPI0014225F33|nr:hypothetical protein [Paraflavitalea devenefica]NII27087.1 hypothetical protein [Paraflavitalea devenefica]
MRTPSYLIKASLLLAGIMAVVLSEAQVAPVAGALFPRKYKVGEKYRYRLTTEQYYNKNWNSTSVVIIECTVVADSAGVLWDEVRNLSKIMYTPNDTTNMDKEAQAVKPYRITLQPHGKIEIPKLEVAAMTGPVTDFITFFVAISPQSLITTLQKKGDSLVVKEPAKGNFTNGTTIPYGEDCLAITGYVTDLTSKAVKLRTKFMPPARSCLTFLLDDMSKPVTAGIPNNFQMVQPAAPDKYNVLFGNEEFTINSVVSRKDGKIMAADMSNTLHLTMRMNCTGDYKNCQMEAPFHIQRNLKLELL